MQVYHDVHDIQPLTVCRALLCKLQYAVDRTSVLDYAFSLQVSSFVLRVMLRRKMWYVWVRLTCGKNSLYILEEAKTRVINDPSSNRTWNYCWLVLTKIKTE
jgi:hypothetical protein